MPNIASTIVRSGDVQVVVMAHNRAKLTDEEWEAGYLRHIREVRATAGLESAANLVFAEGQGPNAKQRATGNAIFDSGGYRFRVGVVTDSLMVRGAVTALSWFNPLIYAFAPDAWEQACTHVRLSRADHPALLAALRTLQSQVSDVPALHRVAAALTMGAAGSPRTHA